MAQGVRSSDRRGWPRRILRALAIGAGLTIGATAVWLATAGYADLRTEPIRKKGADPELLARGRHLLRAAAVAHGLDAFEEHETFEAVATDVWNSDGPWWPANPQRFRAQRRLRTFTSRVRLLDGPLAGETWGLQSWAAYKIVNDAPPRFRPDRAIEFYLPTLQYFDELPFRMLRAPLVLDAGQGLYLGKTCDRVFVTWATPEPHAEHDQYVLWIDPETRLVDAVRYTLRDAVPLSSPLMRPVMKAFAAGTIHFRKYRRVAGVMVPFEQTVTLAPPEETRLPLDEQFFHRLVLETARFDTFDPDVLIADPTRRELGDRKP